MNRTAKTVRLLQAIAAIAGLAVLLWSLGLPSLRLAEAASLTSVSNTLSDSDPSALSTHTIAFTIPAGSNGIDTTGETIVVTFPDGFNLSTSTVAFGDITLSVGGAAQTVAAAAAGATWGASIASQDLTLTTDTGTVTAGQEVIIGVGTAGTARQVTNHSATTSYEFLIDVASGQDTGRTRVAIIENVDVTARVDTVFTFAVAGVGGGQTVNGTTTNGTSSATAIPFGTLTAGNSTTTAHDLTVTTNAGQGYTVTVVADSELVNSTGDEIAGFSNGSYVTDPTTWSSPLGTIGTPETYGHWGVTSDDTNTFARGAEEFGANEWVSASTTPIAVLGHDGPSNGTGTGEGTTRVGYQVEISSLQAAGDYSTVLTYIATPVF